LRGAPDDDAGPASGFIEQQLADPDVRLTESLYVPL
jgi:hypothetical protein